MVIIDPDMIYLTICSVDITSIAEETILAKSFVQAKIDCPITEKLACRNHPDDSKGNRITN